jgi:hypothetical protein
MSHRKEHTMRYMIIGIVIILMAATAAPVLAHIRPPIPGEVSVEIVSGSGSTFQSFPHQDLWREGTRLIKKYLEAKKGENYGIVIRNNTPERIGVVIAVDGRNIISGSRSDLKNSETMYIVNPFEQAQYDGWRTTDSEVHRFYFTEPANSYAVRTFADSSAMGVIAVAVFREQARPQPLLEKKQGAAVPAAPSSSDAARSKGKALADESAGTGFGDSQYSPVVRVDFEPERVPSQKTLVKYEWRETLCKKGLLQCGKDRKNRLWDQEGYAPYPPGYPAN